MEVLCGWSPLWLRIWAKGGGGRVSEEELDGKASWLQLRLGQLQPGLDEAQLKAVMGCCRTLCLCLKENYGP